jgi:hypothetical protein
MTRENFSNGFDTLLNSFGNTIQYGEPNAKIDIALDEYEKSLFLTQAQEEEVLSLYNGKNIDKESFESTEELRRYLAPLIEEAELSPITTSNGKFLGLESNSKFFTLPENLWFITFERVLITDGKCEGSTSLDVYPVRQDEYHKIRKNPFRGANDRRALRLDLSEGNVEIISKYGITSYYVRYLRKLKPIILSDLGNEISINGVSKATDCELPDILHQRILERAVMMALRSRGIRNENNNENR